MPLFDLLLSMFSTINTEFGAYILAMLLVMFAFQLFARMRSL